MSEKIDIPQTTIEKLERYSKQFGIPVNDLTTELTEYLPQIKSEYPNLSMKQQVAQAYRNLITRLAQDEGGIRATKAVPHTVFFVGDSGVKDEAKKKINKINRMPPEEKKIYNPEPNVYLDYKDPSMKPITPIEHRVLYGIGSSGTSIDMGRTQFVKLDVWKESVSKIVPELNVLYTFRANPKQTDKQLPFYDLGASSATRLRKSDVTLSNEAKYELIKASGKDIFSIGDMDVLYDTRFKRDPANKMFGDADPVFIEAFVSNVVIREEKNNIVNLYDETDDGLVYATAYIPHSLPLKFNNNDRVVLLASVGELTFGNSTEPTKVLYVKGFFVVPADSALEPYV